ncbi:P-loop containing nucleoside triphosphate hydrolase protein [Xylariomycetidae sp. FL0641]|nr:P-loop containing nucleoside triphosphate hydrolase protein [Xylariomycetidae sp. FL0641]
MCAVFEDDASSTHSDSSLSSLSSSDLDFVNLETDATVPSLPSHDNAINSDRDSLGFAAETVGPASEAMVAAEAFTDPTTHIDNLSSPPGKMALDSAGPPDAPSTVDAADGNGSSGPAESLPVHESETRIKSANSPTNTPATTCHSKTHECTSVVAAEPTKDVCSAAMEDAVYHDAGVVSHDTPPAPSDKMQIDSGSDVQEQLSSSITTSDDSTSLPSGKMEIESTGNAQESGLNIEDTLNREAIPDVAIGVDEPPLHEPTQENIRSLPGNMAGSVGPAVEEPDQLTVVTGESNGVAAGNDADHNVETRQACHGVHGVPRRMPQEPSMAQDASLQSGADIQLNTAVLHPASPKVKSEIEELPSVNSATDLALPQKASQGPTGSLHPEHVSDEAVQSGHQSDINALKRKESSPSDAPNKRQKKSDDTSKKRSGKPAARKGDNVQAVFANLRAQDAIEVRRNMPDVPEAKKIEASTKGIQMAAIKANRPEDIQKSDQVKYNKDMKRLDRATVALGAVNCTAENGVWRINGIILPVYSYQVCAAGEMVQLERSSCHGGFLADDMGLGKSLEVVCCAVSNQPTAKSRFKPTLIVVQSDVHVTQWMRELVKYLGSDADPDNERAEDTDASDAAESDIKHTKRIRVGHYKKNMEKALPTDFWGKCDYILTTYAEVRKACPPVNIRDELDKVPKDSPEYDKLWKKHAGLLLKRKWHRVVLDEAHTIKAKNTSASVACGFFRAKHKWVVTGTLTPNGPSELASYFRFLDFDPKQPEPGFTARFGRPEMDTLAARQAQILSHCMIRRHKGDIFLGRPMCDLPGAQKEDQWLTMTKEEEDIYELVQNSFHQRLQNDIEKANNEEDRRRVVRLASEFFLREREAVNHLFLLETAINDLFTEEDIQTLVSTVSEESDPGHFYRLFYAHASKRLDALEYRHQATDGQPSDSGLQDPVMDMDALFGRTGADSADAGYEAAEEDGSYPDTSTLGNASHVRHTTAKAPGQEHDPELNKRARGSDFNGIHPKSHTQSRFLDAFDSLPANRLILSTKTAAVKDTVLEWQQTAPNDKILVFVQFATSAMIIGRILEAENIPFLYFTGTISGARRAQQLQDFLSEEKKIKVMIIGFHCGNTGLNIPCANRVIIVDLWWNREMEEQAISRVFRTGQEKEVIVKRLLIKGTVDEHLSGIQKDKFKYNEWVAGVMNGRKTTDADLNMLRKLALFRNFPKDETVDSLVNQSTSDPTTKTNGKTTRKPTGKTTGKPTGKSTGKPGGKSSGTSTSMSKRK